MKRQQIPIPKSIIHIMETLPCLQTNLQAIMAGRQEVGGGITSDIEVTDLTFDFLFLPNNSESLALSTFRSFSTLMVKLKEKSNNEEDKKSSESKNLEMLRLGQ